MKGRVGTAGNMDLTHHHASEAHCQMIDVFGNSRERATKKAMMRQSLSAEACGKWKEQYQPEYWHALIDIKTGQKVKWAAMSFDERKQRNLVTYPLGLCWKRCDPP